MKIGANHERLVRATLRQEVFTPDRLGMRTGFGSAWNRSKGKFLAGDGFELYSPSGVHMDLRCGLLSVNKAWLGYSSPIRGGKKMLPGWMQLIRLRQRHLDALECSISVRQLRCVWNSCRDPTFPIPVGLTERRP
jgi:hypothetical protein